MRKLAIILMMTLSCWPVKADESRAKKVFQELSTLVGNWVGSTQRGSHQVNFRLTANGTALVETWTMSPTRESLTIYTVDGDRLLATHYCPQGNQPRLVLAKKDEDGQFVFNFLDGTGLQDPKGDHQHYLSISIQSKNQFTRAETYISNGKTNLAGEKLGEPIQYQRIQ